MTIITKCLNEWNATIEALGQGKQTILIRKYGTTLEKFLLFPTVSYANKDNYLSNFETKYWQFVKENALPNKDKNKTEVKYFAIVDKVIEKTARNIGYLEKYHIWTNEHVKSYLSNKNAYIWILRVYELNEHILAEKTRGIQYANLLEGVSLEGNKPVLNDKEFSKIVKEIN